MAQPKGIRWPEELEDEIEKARVEDCRGAFSDEVIYLTRLGLQERQEQRTAIERDRQSRRKRPSLDASIEHTGEVVKNLLGGDDKETAEKREEGTGA